MFSNPCLLVEYTVYPRHSTWQYLHQTHINYSQCKSNTKPKSKPRGSAEPPIKISKPKSTIKSIDINVIHTKPSISTIPPEKVLLPTVEPEPLTDIIPEPEPVAEHVTELQNISVINDPIIESQVNVSDVDSDVDSTDATPEPSVTNSVLPTDIDSVPSV